MKHDLIVKYKWKPKEECVLGMSLTSLMYNIVSNRKAETTVIRRETLVAQVEMSV